MKQFLLLKLGSLSLLGQVHRKQLLLDFQNRKSLQPACKWDAFHVIWLENIRKWNVDHHQFLIPAIRQTALRQACTDLRWIQASANSLELIVLWELVARFSDKYFIPPSR